MEKVFVLHTTDQESATEDSKSRLEQFVKYLKSNNIPHYVYNMGQQIYRLETMLEIQRCTCGLTFVTENFTQCIQEIKDIRGMFGRINLSFENKSMIVLSDDNYSKSTFLNLDHFKFLKEENVVDFLHNEEESKSKLELFFSEQNLS